MTEKLLTGKVSSKKPNRKLAWREKIEGIIVMLIAMIILPQIVFGIYDTEDFRMPLSLKIINAIFCIVIWGAIIGFVLRVLGVI